MNFITVFAGIVRKKNYLFFNYLFGVNLSPPGISRGKDTLTRKGGIPCILYPPVCSSPVGENALLVEVRGESAD